MMSTTTTTNTTWEINLHKIYDESVKTKSVNTPEGFELSYVLRTISSY